MTIFLSKYDQTGLINDLKLISSWLESNKLTSKIKKKNQIFQLGPKNFSDKKLNWNWQEVEESKCVKFLGVKIGNQLTLDEHIDFVK